MATVISLADSLAWACLALSAALAGIYELRFHWLMRRQPATAARVVHSQVRVQWAEAIMRRPGSEVLAVQTIRNSVMSATIIGSTAALALMGAASLAVTQLMPAAFDLDALLLHPAPRALLFALLLGVLFAILLFAVMAMRFYNHAGYLLALITLADTQHPAQRRAAPAYLAKASMFHSMSMRGLLWLTAIAAGLVSPYLLPLATLAVLRILLWFDRTPQALGPD